MPRIPQVMRTMQTTLVSVLCLDLETRKTFEKIVRLARTYKTENQMLQKIRPLIENDKTKVVHVLASEPQIVKFTMTEQQYIDTAMILEIH